MDEEQTRTFQLMHKLTKQMQALKILESTDEEIREMQKTCELIKQGTMDKAAIKTAQAVERAGVYIEQARNADSDKQKRAQMKKALNRIQKAENQMNKYLDRIEKEVD